MASNLSGKNTAYEMWNNLERSFTSILKTRVMEIELQLQTTRKDGLSVIDYFILGRPVEE